MYQVLLFPKIMLLLSLLMLNTHASRDYRMEVIGNAGFVASPNHPDKYPKNISCLWNITVEYGFALNATVLNMDMEKTADCYADFLQIRTSPHGQWKDYKRHCSSVPVSIFSESGWVQIRFVSDEKNEFTGFNLTWSAVERKLRPSENSIILRPSPSMLQNCIGIPIFYDTVTISSCLRSHANSATARSVLNRTNCLCGPLKRNFYFSWSSTSKGRTMLQTPIQSSLFDTYLKFSLATSTVNLIRSSERRPSISHSISTYHSSATGKHWKTEVLRPSGISSPTKERSWKSENLNSLGTFTSFVKGKSLKTKIIPSSATFASSVNDMPWKTDILPYPNTFSTFVKGKSRKTEILQSSNTISSSLWAMSGEIITLQSLSSYFSKVPGVKNESRNAGFSSSIQTTITDKTSASCLLTSHMPVGCREKAKADSIHSSLVKILWPVGGTFLFISILLLVLLCREAKLNRIGAS